MRKTTNLNIANDTDGGINLGELLEIEVEWARVYTVVKEYLPTLIDCWIGLNNHILTHLQLSKWRT